MKVIIASTSTDLMGEQFSQKCLEDMIGETVPVTIQFDYSKIVGECVITEVEEEFLWGEIDLSNLYAVPGFVRHDSGDTINSVTLMSVGLTNKPADPTIPPIGETNEN